MAEGQSLLMRKTLLVITGASQGYGECLAKTFAQRLPSGSACLLLSRKPAKVEEIRTENMEAFYEKFDQSNFAECGRLFIQGMMDKNGIKLADYEQTMIIHNSGVLGDLTKFAWEMEDKDMVANVINVNITGMILLNSALMQCCEDAGQKNISIINISTLAAVMPLPSCSLYCASKAARDMYLQVLAKERSWVRVLNWAPGPLDTEMMVSCRQCADDELRQSYIEMHEKKTLLTCSQSAEKLMLLLERNTFKSGEHIDYYDVKE
ncbi:SPRE-like protein [Mya arenaria]|uniref:Sepiapterin reductase n=1 Tax=Mya arenaria TaxID=6604 RepID=A0ABY7DCM9_MYAAR|nr:sepiapterin reductase-like [Mya arenaria]XP_052815052.1 sepiapterin reductase-like [Mya arenaria]WAQ95064.1 SPRE-like protein [Mya arenaria]